MAFQRAQAISPIAISDMWIELHSPDTEGGGAPGATFTVVVRYSDGSSRTLTGDLAPHITAQQRNGLLSFMAALRTLAETEIL